MLTSQAGRDAMRVFQRSQETVARRIAGEFLLVPVRGRLADLHRIYALNPAAACMWEALGSGTQSAATLADAVVAAFAIGREEAVRDVEEFLEELLREGLVAPEATP